MKITLERIVIVALAVALAFTQFRNCKTIKQLKNDNVLLSMRNQKLDSIKNELGQTVTTQKAIITQNQNEIKAISAEVFNLSKKVEKQAKTILFYLSHNTVTKIDSVQVPFKDTSDVREFTSLKEFQKFAKDSMIVVPKKVTLDSSRVEYKNGFRFDGTVTKTGLIINQTSFVDSQYLRVVEKKRNLWQFITFKRRPIEVQVLHTSPYIHVTGQNSVIYQPRGSAGLLKVGIPLGLGIFLGTQL